MRGRSLCTIGALAVGFCAVPALALQGRLIAIDSSRALYDIDVNTGAKTQFATASANAGTTGGLAYDEDTGTVWLTSTSLDQLFTLDLVTGNATLVGDYGSNVVMHGLEWDSSTNTLYGASSTPNTFYKIDINTGFATAIGGMGLNSFWNLGYDSDTDTLYGTHSGTTDSFYRIDRTTGTPTLIGVLGGVPASTNPNGLAYDRDNGIMYMIDNTTDFLYKIDVTTGAATAIGSTGTGNLLGLLYIPKIPAPGAVALLGLAALPLRRRRA